MVAQVKKRGRRVQYRRSPREPWQDLPEGEEVNFGDTRIHVSHKNGRSRLHRHNTRSGNQLKPVNIGDGTYIVGLRGVQRV